MGTDKFTQHVMLSQEKNPSQCGQAPGVVDVGPRSGRQIQSIRAHPCNPRSKNQNFNRVFGWPHLGQGAVSVPAFSV